MQEIICRPEIHHFDTFKEFAAELQLGQGDLVVTESFVAEKFQQLFNGADVLIYSDYCQGEPSDEGFMKLAAKAAELGEHGRVIGIGGGSVLDMSKVLSLESYLPVEKLFSKQIPAKKGRKLVLVPTTCGTGSEVTNISIMAFVAKQCKMGLADNALFADMAVLVPELLKDLPFKFFMTSSVDALIHAMESILSPKANEYTKLFGYRALDMILTAYTRIAARGPESRYDLLDDFLIASNFAGLAFGTAGCGTVHAMSYPLGGTFHVPHGEANYAVLKGVMDKYMEGGLEGELLVLCRHIGAILYGEPADAMKDLGDLLGDIMPVKSLSEYGADEAMVAKWAHEVMEGQQRLLANSYRPLEEEDILTIYKNML